MPDLKCFTGLSMACLTHRQAAQIYLLTWKKLLWAITCSLDIPPLKFLLMSHWIDFCGKSLATVPPAGGGINLPFCSPVWFTRDPGSVSFLSCLFALRFGEVCDCVYFSEKITTSSALLNYPLNSSTQCSVWFHRCWCDRDSPGIFSNLRMKRKNTMTVSTADR